MKSIYTLRKLTILLILIASSINAQILTEDFESGTFPPAGWAVFRGVNDIGPNNDWESTTDTNSGTYAAFSRYSDPNIGIAAEDWLVTPLIDLTNMNNTTLSFFEKETYNCCLSQYDIRVSTNSQTNHEDFVTVVTYNDLNNIYEERIIDLGQYDGQEIYIAFVHTDEYQDDWFLDDITVFENTFISTWQTSAANESITIPTINSETYNYNVDWGDGTTTTNHTGNASHTYTTQGSYDVTITGLFPRIYFLGIPEEESDKIIDIKQWGDNPWTSMRFAFARCSNLQISATDAPDLSNVINISGMFFEVLSFNQSINHWDVSNIISMREVFLGATSFNQPLDTWNVSNVGDMTRMFHNASSFNQPLSTWNVDNTSLMDQLFDGASSFNQPLNTWNTSNATRILFMFRNATSFNQPLDTWDVGNVVFMQRMFQNATSFNQQLDTWDVGNVTNMEFMFDNSNLSVENYDQTLQAWAALPSLQANVPLGASGVNYCNGEAARDILTNTHNWVITDGGLDCSSLNIDDESLQNVTLYPNPATDYIRISNLDIENNYTIYDALGKTVLSGKMVTENNISIRALEKGIYFLKLNNYETLRFIKD